MMNRGRGKREHEQITMNIELTRNTHAILRVQPGTREAKPNGQAEMSLGHFAPQSCRTGFKADK
jgi:hypothetical protein